MSKITNETPVISNAPKAINNPQTESAPRPKTPQKVVDRVELNSAAAQAEIKNYSAPKAPKKKAAEAIKLPEKDYLRPNEILAPFINQCLKNAADCTIVNTLGFLTNLTEINLMLNWINTNRPALLYPDPSSVNNSVYKHIAHHEQGTLDKLAVLNKRYCLEKIQNNQLKISLRNNLNNFTIFEVNNQSVGSTQYQSLQSKVIVSFVACISNDMATVDSNMRQIFDLNLKYVSDQLDQLKADSSDYNYSVDDAFKLLYLLKDSSRFFFKLQNHLANSLHPDLIVEEFLLHDEHKKAEDFLNLAKKQKENPIKLKNLIVGYKKLIGYWQMNGEIKKAMDVMPKVYALNNDEDLLVAYVASAVGIPEYFSKAKHLLNSSKNDQLKSLLNQYIKYKDSDVINSAQFSTINFDKIKQSTEAAKVYKVLNFIKMYKNNERNLKQFFARDLKDLLKKGEIRKGDYIQLSLIFNQGEKAKLIIKGLSEAEILDCYELAQYKVMFSDNTDYLIEESKKYRFRDNLKSSLHYYAAMNQLSKQEGALYLQKAAQHLKLANELDINNELYQKLYYDTNNAIETAAEKEKHEAKEKELIAERKKIEELRKNLKVLHTRTFKEGIDQAYYSQLIASASNSSELSSVFEQIKAASIEAHETTITTQVTPEPKVTNLVNEEIISTLSINQILAEAVETTSDSEEEYRQFDKESPTKDQMKQESTLLIKQIQQRSFNFSVLSGWQVDKETIKFEKVTSLGMHRGVEYFGYISPELKVSESSKTLQNSLSKGIIHRKKGQNGVKFLSHRTVELKINQDLRLYTNCIYANENGKCLILFNKSGTHKDVERFASGNTLKYIYPELKMKA
jgi:hypothetical protein